MLVLLFSYHTLMIFVNFLFLPLFSMQLTILCTISMFRLWISSSKLAFELESVLLDIVDLYRKSIIDFNAGKLNLNHLIVQMTLVVLM